MNLRMTDKIGVRPKALMCHICGREFGTASLAIHEKQCIEKWEQQESLKPKHLRRPVPEAPEANIQTSSWSDINAFNEQANEAYNAQTLVACENCGRTFLEDRLVIHLRSCKTPKPQNPKHSKPLLDIDEAPPNFRSPQPTKKSHMRNIFSETKQDKLVACKKCGKKFTEERLLNHEKLCRGSQTIRKEAWGSENETKSTEDIPSWKKKHIDMVNMMKYQRKVDQALKEGKDIRNIEAPKELIDVRNDYVECPHCGRSFNEEAADRHIPKCANIINKPKPVNKAKAEDRKLVQNESRSSLIERNASNIMNTEKVPIKANCRKCTTPYIPNANFCAMCGTKRN